jgi:hypothetical protein
VTVFATFSQELNSGKKSSFSDIPSDSLKKDMALEELFGNIGAKCTQKVQNKEKMPFSNLPLNEILQPLKGGVKKLLESLHPDTH